MHNWNIIYKCPLCEKLGKDFRKFSKENPHLIKYIHKWYRKYGNIPEFLTTLTRDLAKNRWYNIIYPVGGPIFIHVYRTSGQLYGTYKPIEPLLPRKYKFILQKIEDVISLLIDKEELDIDTESLEDIKERIKVLERLFNKIVKVDNSVKGIEVRKTKILVNEELYRPLKYEFFREKLGLGDLEPFIRDPYLEDISCDGLGPIFVVHKIFGTLESTIKFKSDDELNAFVIRLCERIGKVVSPRNPIIDASLPDGSRINIVFGRDVSRKGTNFTIRKFSKTPLSITQLIELGTLDPMIAAYIWLMIEHKMSIFICGETASGKTTTLNAIAVFIRPEAKVISIEDTPEVYLPHPNWISEVTKKGHDEKTSIELYDLLKTALRQRPDYIIVGEIRGREGYVAFQAMQTGHPVLATFHAGNMEKLIQRLTGQPINIPPAYLDNLNVVIFQSLIIEPSVKLPKRRVTSVNEIVGIDPTEGSCNYIEIFHWDSITDQHIFRGEGNSYLLENKIAIMRGLAQSEVMEIYKELKIRAQILKRLVKNRILNYFDVWKVISTIYELPMEEALRRIDIICSKVLRS